MTIPDQVDNGRHVEGERYENNDDVGVNHLSVEHSSYGRSEAQAGRQVSIVRMGNFLRPCPVPLGRGS
jgi:hypothetical protein